jgi:hypothetical protein
VEVATAGHTIVLRRPGACRLRPSAGASHRPATAARSLRA